MEYNMTVNDTENAVADESDFSSQIDSDDVEARYSNFVANGYESLLSSNDNNSFTSNDGDGSGKLYFYIYN